MENTRVVITGLGTINAIARDAPAFAVALQQGRCGIGRVSVFDTAAFPTHTGGEVNGFAPREDLPPSFCGKRMSRSDAMAMAATLEALRDAGLFPLPEDLRGDTGVVIGGGAGGMPDGETAYRRYLAGGADRTRFSDLIFFEFKARLMRISNRSRFKGLVRKSKAPRFMASTAVSTLP